VIHVTMLKPGAAEGARTSAGPAEQQPSASRRPDCDAAGSDAAAQLLSGERHEADEGRAQASSHRLGGCSAPAAAARPVGKRRGGRCLLRDERPLKRRATALVKACACRHATPTLLPTWEACVVCGGGGGALDRQPAAAACTLRAVPSEAE